jgi:predicted transcriptional regulator
MSDTPRVDAIRRKNYRTVYGEMGQLAEELERKNAQLREALAWAMKDLREPTLIPKQNQEHYDAYHKARAALEAV